MKTASQIVVVGASFLLVFILGNYFDRAFWQAGFHARKLLGGMPLPRMTEFMIGHHHLASYVALFPWLWLAGAPLISRHAARGYWDPVAFVLRFLAFACCEVLLLLVGLLALFLPFIPYYGVLQSAEWNVPEQTVRMLFWLCAAMVSIAAFSRARSS